MAKLSGWDDTIVALATPQGIGALGVIRISGRNAITVVNDLFPSKNLEQLPTHTLHVGILKNNGEILDEVVLSIYKSPKSYTGENIIEISCHGSPFIQEKIVQAIASKGCRMAKPGEFTQRAFLNGKLDLTQAEAVADLIASNTEASRKTALKNIRGGFSNALSALREQLIKFSALIELELDFWQEDVEFADRTMLKNLIKQLTDSTQQLLQSFALGNVIKNGVQVAIIGKPNAGKSTLLNTLLNENRAIVSEIAGTTRDTIEEILNIDGVLFRLIDTAGIRTHTSDTIESMGVERSLQKMNEADLIIYLFDVNEMGANELIDIIKEFKQQSLKYILIGNKVDVHPIFKEEKFQSIPHIIFISAKNNINVDVLKEKLLSSAIQGDIDTEATIVTNARHYTALKKLADSLQDVVNGMEENIQSDFLALDIRQCLYYLGEITGEITNEDQLDFIFSKFCIGK
ncbi:MAG: tRNA uridine-5-carboxymethylaminomethyl(34) synthesis GTPase MnmE [Chitinophagaceae bacterium]|nr:tRNA uridine-5-carboxymethylaminomethyl(34) synthesis GTPase MnmE [Chitinophagaceae bacterium]